MKPEVARRRIEAFERRFGRTHLIFACHGAFPLALTPDLLYKLWANFQRDIHGKVLGIPWVAVADLLLSSLCDEVGRELYEMDTAVRNSLLNRLKEDDNFGQIRINELSDFLLVYVRQQLQSNDQEVRDFAQAQRWTALAYVRPNEAAQELRLALEQTYQQDKSEQVRLVSLVEAFAESLAEFEPLLVYAREIGKFKRSDKTGSLSTSKQTSEQTNIAIEKTNLSNKSISGKLVILNFDGKFNTGFTITMKIIGENNLVLAERIGKLPPAPHIPQLYNIWQSRYRQMISTRFGFGLEPSLGHLTNFSNRDLDADSNALKEQLNHWLKSPEFFPVMQVLLMTVKQDEEVRVIIQTEDSHLRRLPWHLWDFVNHYSRAEVALSLPTTFKQAKQTNKPALPRAKVRILSLNSGMPINIERDRQFWESLPDAEIMFLVEPTRRELNKQLWDSDWDILFFAGHGNKEGETGQIAINPEESLSINELRNGLQTAIDQGLQLAVFNSCDGLELVQELADLKMPQIIVMREEVPDIVAQEFQKYFLQAFSNGKSLYLSVREARERLEGLEDNYPCASWLPVIFQNSAEAPWNWQGLIEYYAQLKKLLAGGNWKEADEETARLMLRVAGREKEGYFDDISQIYKIPGEVLRTIDILWVNYSNARFGLSIQKRIYQSLGGTREYNRKIWEEFGENVGWRRDNKWLLYVYLDFSLNAPEGCYPAQVLRVYEAGGVWVVDEFSAVLLSRSELEGELQD